MDYKKLCMEVIQNYPEYSSEWIQCTKWGDYESCMRFRIDDPDYTEDNTADAWFSCTIGNDEECTHSFDDMAEALKKMCHIHIDTPYRFCNWNPHNEGTYDAEVLDALMQMTFLNDVVYG